MKFLSQYGGVDIEEDERQAFNTQAPLKWWRVSQTVGFFVCVYSELEWNIFCIEMKFLNIVSTIINIDLSFLHMLEIFHLKQPNSN